MAAPLDMMGTEKNWHQDGRFSPPDAAFFYLKRTLSWRKPYMFLMNTHFETWTTGMTERYMQLCLFYGMFPGFFSENAASNCYFANPAWYNRDRPLFRKYMPIIQRVAQAGWEPITRANCDVADVWIERWGRSTESGMYFTVMNTASAPRQATLTFDFAPAASLDASAAIVDAGDDREMGSASRCTLDLGPGEVRALRVQPR